jgi:hypothetical protein
MRSKADMLRSGSTLSPEFRFAHPQSQERSPFDLSNSVLPLQFPKMIDDRAVVGLGTGPSPFLRPPLTFFMRGKMRSPASRP